jgi:hypothetical protein
MLTKDGEAARLIGWIYPEALMPLLVVFCQETSLYDLKRCIL